MNAKSFTRFGTMLLVLALVSISCSLGTTLVPEPTLIPADTLEPPADTPEPPTDTPEPPPTDTPVPTEIPTPAPQDFFTEEFETDTEYWDVFFLGKGDSEKTRYGLEDGFLVADLGDTNVYAYFYYTPYIYTDVAIRVRAENRGRNNNNVSLTCRMSAEGWYEFSVESGGVWYLYAVQDGEYQIIGSGGAKSLKMGLETNEYAMICKGNEITLIVNDVELKTMKDTIYLFEEGNVGINISSLNVLPIVVAVDWFEISEP